MQVAPGQRISDLNIPSAILATLAYFDVFDYPLTSLETHKFLWQRRVTLGAVVDTLARLEQAGRVSRRWGYYFLPGREALVATRQRRYLAADYKFRRALRAARLLRIFPNVLLVAVCNNLAISNARPASDIDLFIVTARGRIWLTRLLAVAGLQLLGLRHHGRHVTDRCCLSFFVTDDHLALRDVALAPEDPYLCYWLVALTPLYVRAKTWERLGESNRWIFQSLPNARPRLPSARRQLPARSRLPHPWRLGAWLEARVKLPQLAHLKRRGLNPRDTAVVINDAMLKFHTVDRREQYRKRWRKRIAEL